MKNPTRTSRRTFLKTAGSSAGLLMAGLPRGWTGSVYAQDGPETPDVRFGMIALTDCAPIVIAHELGYFKKFGINSVVSKEASWAAIRDKLSIGENQATHMLLGMPLASTMGLGRIAGEADGGAVAAESERSGDHAQQHAEGGRRPHAAGAQAASWTRRRPPASRCPLP